MSNENEISINSDAEAFSIEAFLPYRLNILAKRISHDLSEIYTREFGLTIPEWRTLLWLNSNDEVYAKDICYHCLMDKTQVSRVIGSLEARHLIQRETDSKDQRSHLLSLTHEGNTLIAEIIPKVKTWEKQLVASLTEQQYQMLFSMIDDLEAQLDKTSIQ